jgi:hypothetical protein
LICLVEVVRHSRIGRALTDDPFAATQDAPAGPSYGCWTRPHTGPVVGGVLEFLDGLPGSGPA